MPAGSAAKASSVGAKTVNGPSERSRSASPAACTAATSVWNLAATAVSTMFGLPRPSKKGLPLAGTFGGDWAPAPAATLQGLSMAPAAFREIDGEILARQYVAYCKLMENDEKARKPDVDDVAFSEAPMPELRGEVRQVAGEAAAPTGWVSHLTRLWRRPPAAP